MNLAPLLPVLIDPLFARENSLRGEPGLVSHSKAAVGNAKFLAPLRKRQGSSVVRKSDVVSPVVHLCFTGGPYAIARLVVAVVVLPFERCSERARAHISQKVLELGPSVTHQYSSLTIVRETLNAWIATAIEHRLPHSVFAGLAHAVSSRSRSCGRPAAGASTRRGIARSEIRCSDLTDFSAIASASPPGRRITQARNSNKSTKTDTADVDNFHAGIVQGLACHG